MAIVAVLHSLWAVLLPLLITQSCRDGRFDFCWLWAPLALEAKTGRSWSRGRVTASSEVPENHKHSLCDLLYTVCPTCTAAVEIGNWRWQVGTISLLSATVSPGGYSEQRKEGERKGNALLSSQLKTAHCAHLPELGKNVSVGW